MPKSEREVVFTCFFCGEARDANDPVTIKAYWEEDGKEQWQAWGAHRACVIENMSEETRAFGGPLTGD